MLTWLRWLIAAPFLLLLVLFVLSNTQTVTLRLWPTDLALPIPLAIAVLGGMAIGLLAGVAVWDRIRKAPATRAGTWDCGFQAPTARIQYTGASFAQMLTDSFRWVLRPTERRPRIQGLFPRVSVFRAKTPDLFLEGAVKPFLGFAAWAMSYLRILQAGHLPIYLLYVVLTLVALFAWTLA